MRDVTPVLMVRVSAAAPERRLQQARVEDGLFRCCFAVTMMRNVGILTR